MTEAADAAWNYVGGRRPGSEGELHRAADLSRGSHPRTRLAYAWRAEGRVICKGGVCSSYDQFFKRGRYYGIMRYVKKAPSHRGEKHSRSLCGPCTATFPPLLEPRKLSFPPLPGK